MDGADQHVVLTVAVLPRQLASEKAVAVLMAADKPDETANDDGEAKSPSSNFRISIAVSMLVKPFCRSIQSRNSIRKWTFLLFEGRKMTDT
jgi:hypothetical protein